MKSKKYNPKNNFGIRQTWEIKPTQRIHNPSGKKYSRKKFKITKELT